MLRPFLRALSVPAAGLALLFFASLAVEDQRAFASCRINGQSVDACLLKISGR